MVAPNLIPKGQECPLDDLAELYKLGLSMQIICEKEKGIGLSAVQVGVPLNFFVVNFYDNYRFFINCSYSPVTEEKEKYIEGCLSLKTLEGKLRFFEVERFKAVIVKGKELVSEPLLQIKDVEMNLTDFYKIVFQHEIDHASDILISQIGKEVFLWSK
jgi:peptide deformylase